MPAMARRFTLLICLLGALGLPAGIAHAQSSPFAPLPPAQTTPDVQPTVTSSDTSTDNGGLKSWQQILIFAGGGILLIGIAWAIVTDARSHTSSEDDTEERHEARLRKEEDVKRRKARNRAAGKRARESRKRNR
jgi:uncharacterized oligopeptide transporter (OPT) family protein